MPRHSVFKGQVALSVITTYEAYGSAVHRPIIAV